MKKDKRDQLTPAQEARRLEIEQMVGELTYRGVMDALGLPNTSYLSDFVKWGIIPGNREIAALMGIPKAPSKGKQRYNRRSDEARKKGWDNWNEVGRYVENGWVELPEKPAHLSATQSKQGEKVLGLGGRYRLVRITRGYDATDENYGQTGRDEDAKDCAGEW